MDLIFPSNLFDSREKNLSAFKARGEEFIPLPLPSLLLVIFIIGVRRPPVSSCNVNDTSVGRFQPAFIRHSQPEPRDPPERLPEGAWKVGFSAVLFERVTGRPLICFHAYEMLSSSGSLEWEPSSVTLAPLRTLWSCPASASGGRLADGSLAGVILTMHVSVD